jgi:hypothetical protein
MSPEERQMLERSLKLSAENHKMLVRIERRAKWMMLWGLVKLAVIAVPLVLGYLYLEPYFAKAAENYNSFAELVSHVNLGF